MDSGNSWSFPFFYLGINCGPPPKIIDGTVQCSDTTSNGMAEYKCNEGFLLVGSSTMVCQSDGKTAKWTSLDNTNSAPVCRCMLLFDVYTVYFILDKQVFFNYANNVQQHIIIIKCISSLNRTCYSIVVIHGRFFGVG